MIISKAAKESIKTAPVQVDNTNSPHKEFISTYGEQTAAGERVNVERSQTLSTFYRAANTIIDDVAMMPFQQFARVDGNISRVEPDTKLYNIPYLMEVSPNQWGWTPFQFKQVKMQWKLFHGNSYVWRPPVFPQQLLILPADITRPVIEKETGRLWYEVRFSNTEKPEYIPDVEIMHEMINPDASGFIGRGVVRFARETIGRRLGANKTKSKFYSQGLNPSGILFLENIEIKDDAERDKIRDGFTGKISGSDGAYSIAVADKRIRDFKPVSLSPKDSEFLASMEYDDREIANFFKMPLHMLNMGKEAYNSNEQKFGEYLQQTLDPHLVAMEQGARIRWLTFEQQGSNYFKFNRSSLLRMNAKDRAETNEILIRSMQRTPAECREKDDYNAGEEHPELQKFYMTNNYSAIGEKPNAEPNPQRITPKE